MSTQLRRSTRKRVASARQASIQSKVRASSSLPQSPRSIPTPSRRNASSIGDSGVVQMPQIPVHLPNSDVATTGLTILSAATGSTMTHNDPGQSTSDLSMERNHTSVWIVGSSLIKNAFAVARQRPGGVNLGLSNTSIWWLGQSGMRSSQLVGKLLRMLQYEDPPQFLIIHVGTNDIGHMKLAELRNYMKNVLTTILDILPNTALIWSQMLPRQKWRYSLNTRALERGRYRVNNAIASYLLRKGGLYIKYPEITTSCNLFTDDGVHLTATGNHIFLNRIQGGLYEFIYNREKNGPVFPLSI